MTIENTKHCLVIAEVAQGHDGSLGLAHAFIDAVAKTGADAIKFQTHIASEESTAREEWREKFSLRDATRYDYWKRMEFTEEQWLSLKKHADNVGLLFISSPFSLKAVDLLARIGIYAWKIASGEVQNHPMFEAMATKNLPFMLSTGMSYIRELDAAVAKIKALGRPLTLLQCTSEYPCPPEKIGLNMIPFYRERYGCNVGLSDHSGCIYSGLAAATIGIDMIEVHVTLSREMFGPDISSSITTGELKQLVEGIRYIETIQSNPVNKDLIAEEKRELRRFFGKSIVAARDLPKGIILQSSDLALKKPGTGLGPEHMKEAIGRRLRHPLKKDVLLLKEDYE